MKYYHVFLCTAALLILVSCKSRNQTGDSFKAGLRGRVTLSKGNMMPGPGQRERKEKGVKREICIYAVAGATNVTGESPLYTSVNTPLVARVNSDAAGFYQCRLAPGTYSVFTREKDGRLFAALSNDKGEIAVINISAGETLTYNINVNYQAVY